MTMRIEARMKFRMAGYRGKYSQPTSETEGGWASVKALQRGLKKRWATNPRIRVRNIPNGVILLDGTKDTTSRLTQVITLTED